MNYNLWENIIVQERAKLALEKIFRRNAYPPAIIFFGQKGVGKEAHAIAFAQSINCEKQNFQPCGQCERCKRIYNFLSPDIYLIFPTPTSTSEKNLSFKRIERLLEKKKVNPYLKIQLPKANEITIDLIRELRSELVVSTPEIKKRIVIFSQADKLNLESQNALLKLLEEPREDILFILETHSLEPILPTIKSRCWIINFQPLEIETIRNYLKKKFQYIDTSDIINSTLNKFNGENLSEIIEEISQILEERENMDKISSNSEIIKPNFIELFRFLYLSNFYQSMNYLDQYNILSDRYAASNFVNDLLKFCYLVLKTKLSEENKETELIKLSNVIDEIQFQKVIEYLVSCQSYIENYINLNLIFIKLFILINNSFVKK